MYLRWLKMESKKMIIIFFAILKPILKFLYQDRNTAAYFFAVHRTAFSQWIKLHTIICYNLSQHFTAPSLCPGFSPDSANITQMYGCCEWWVCTGGQVRPLTGIELLPWWLWAEGSCRMCWTRLCAACRLQVGHAWPNASGILTLCRESLLVPMAYLCQWTWHVFSK